MAAYKSMLAASVALAVCLSHPGIRSPHAQEAENPSLKAAAPRESSTPVIPNTGNNATILIRTEIQPTVDGRAIAEGDEIRAYTRSGLLVGLIPWQGENCALTVWGDDALTAPVDGLKSGERIILRAWDKLQNKEFEARAVYSADSTYSANSLLILNEFSAEVPYAAVEENAPFTFSLSQNYPNPFNPETTILYELSEASAVSLHILNSLGQTVKTLVEKTEGPGKYSVNWDGTDTAGEKVTSGVYFCRMHAGNHSLVRKLTLLR